MDGITNFGYLRKQHRAPGAYQQISGVSHRRVAGHSGEGIAASTLQSNHQVRRWHGAALAPVKFRQPLFRKAHDRRDNVAKAAQLVILKAECVRFVFQQRKLVGYRSIETRVQAGAALPGASRNPDSQAKVRRQSSDAG